MRAFVAWVMAMLLGACTHAAARPGDATATLRAMTFNIRLDAASDGANGTYDVMDTNIHDGMIYLKLGKRAGL